MGGGLATSFEHVDRYAVSSSVNAAGIFLAASSSKPSTVPFFDGYLAARRRGADLLLTLAQIVRTRYYTPPGMAQRLIQQSDPVITCGGGMLRFEGLSACCGVYARVDFLGSAFDTDRVDPGTSNVDFNPLMRAALARLRDAERPRLMVSSAGFEVMSNAAERSSGGSLCQHVGSRVSLRFKHTNSAWNVDAVPLDLACGSLLGNCPSSGRPERCTFRQ